MGLTARHDGHHEAVQKVSKGVRDDAERRSRELNSSWERMLVGMCEQVCPSEVRVGRSLGRIEREEYLRSVDAILYGTRDGRCE